MLQQLGLDTVKNVMIAFLVLGVIYVAVALALVSLRDTNVFTAGTPEARYVNDSIANITRGAGGFFSNTSAIFDILFVVVIIIAIGIVIAVVSGFQGGRSKRAGL